MICYQMTLDLYTLYECSHTIFHLCENVLL